MGGLEINIRGGFTWPAAIVVHNSSKVKPPGQIKMLDKKIEVDSKNAFWPLVRKRLLCGSAIAGPKEGNRENFQ